MQTKCTTWSFTTNMCPRSVQVPQYTSTVIAVVKVWVKASVNASVTHGARDSHQQGKRSIAHNRYKASCSKRNIAHAKNNKCKGHATGKHQKKCTMGTHRRSLKVKAYTMKNTYCRPMTGKCMKTTISFGTWYILLLLDKLRFPTACFWCEWFFLISFKPLHLWLPAIESGFGVNGSLLRN